MRFICLCVSLLVLSALSAGSVHAQYNYYTSGSFYFNQNNYPDVTAATYRSQQQGKHSDSKPGKSARPTSAKPPTRDADAMNNPLPYTRSTSVSAAVRAAFLADLGKRGAAKDVAQMKAMMERTDFVQLFAGLAQLQGLDSATPEAFTALFYGQAWAIANQRPLPSAGQYRGIARQLRDTNAITSVWRNLGNRQRQEEFEKLAYPLIIQRAHYQTYLGEGKTAALQDMSGRVYAGMKDFQLDMRAMKLGDAGFSKR